MRPQPAPTAHIVKTLEEMTEEELVVERTRVWTICKSSAGFWLRVDETPFRFFPEHSSEDASRDAEAHATKFGIKVKTYIFY